MRIPTAWTDDSRVNPVPDVLAQHHGGGEPSAFERMMALDRQIAAGGIPSPKKYSEHPVYYRSDHLVQGRQVREEAEKACAESRASVKEGM